ncbi:MAG: hypothetical protein COV76_02180 [Candidatus Omnitrophica bacterium CG11_big_fil_rev_8_21_14_0_20_64_10]|nr:MAG: hypothetical protein COV76_02180 [Candidatus Omnitrophica bacterium CG11_big_fil_rev_8_21_14_0_20_64_10]
MALIGEVDWKPEDYLHAAFSHKFTLFMITLVIGSYAYFREAQKPDIYQASTEIVIEQDDADLVQFQRGARYNANAGDQFLRTEHMLIRGPEILQSVVKTLNLDAFPPFARSEYPADLLAGMVSVQPVRGTNLVNISVTGKKPDLVARISDAVAETYADRNLQRRIEKTGGGTQWLQEELAWTEKKMRAAQLELQNFLEEHETVDFSTNRQNTIFQRISDLNRALTQVKQERIEAETRYREKHPILQELLKREAEMEAAFKQQEKKALEFTRLSIQYNVLQRNSETTEGIYDVLLKRLKELSVEGNLQANNIRIISRAKIPKSPIGPNRQRGILVGIFLGLILGCGQAILREMLSKTLRNRREFEGTLQIPFLGALPDIHVGRAHKGKEKLFLIKQPQSTEAESLRAIRTTAEFLLPAQQSSHVLIITSAIPEEGKSLVSLSLAISLAELERRVVFIDADMRRPTVHASVNLPLDPGLSGFLEGKVDPGDLIQTSSEAPGLSVITAGSQPAQPTDLLISGKMKDLIHQLRDEFQYVILDTPPVLAVADTTALASLTDGIIYVVRAGRTPRDVTLAGKTRLTDVGAKLIGGVLNGTQPEKRYVHYYYYQGARKARR